ncbi:hypothetical protein FKM82_031071 [Ascaphus truei]
MTCKNTPTCYKLPMCNSQKWGDSGMLLNLDFYHFEFYSSVPFSIERQSFIHALVMTIVTAILYHVSLLLKQFSVLLSISKKN